MIYIYIQAEEGSDTDGAPKEARRPLLSESNKGKCCCGEGVLDVS